jgi:hypothetical protein
MDKLTRRLGGAPLAGVLIALVPALTLWQTNMNRLGYEHALPTIGVLLLATGLFTAGLFLLLRDWARTGIVAGLSAAWLFYSVPLARTIIGPALAWCGILVLLFVGILIAWRTPQGDEAKLVNGKLNLILIPAAGFFLVAVGWKQWQLEAARPAPASVFEPFVGHADAGSPDVWHILFDRYASRDTLARRYAFDNRPFLNELRKRGFTVAEGSFSNYQRTGHSVSATLNGASLDRLAGSMGSQQTDWVPIYRAISHNRAEQFFDAAGYRTVFAGNWWNPTQELETDETINYHAVSELARKLFDQMPLGLAMRQLRLPYGDDRADHCSRVKVKFAELEKLATQPGRKYVYAHFLVPHPPFVLAANGRCRPVEEAKASSRRDNYVAQVQFVNARVLRLIDAIASGPRPAVIVIHSDEGPWPEPYVGDEHSFGGEPVSVEWTRVDSVRLREKMGILLAVREPSGAPKTMPDSPVQIYPAILRDHFGGGRPLPPSRHEVFESDSRLYTFHDVARRLLAD